MQGVRPLAPVVRVAFHRVMAPLLRHPAPGGLLTRACVSSMATADDTRLMEEALSLAQQAAGRTSPNPLVGALVVANGRIVGRGFHRKAGEAHAEVVALREAGVLARGSTLYTTLEPCAHFGRTGPCTEALLDAGVRRVVAAMVDPDPKADGRGFARLRTAGLAVEVGVQARP